MQAGHTSDLRHSEQPNIEKLFNAIKENTPTDEKRKQVDQLLNEGTNVDCVDITDNNNTPLLVAATRGEVTIFKLLLERGANIYATNNNNENVINVIEHPKTPNRKRLINIIINYYGYTKRHGTAVARGELYETKLLCFILFKALYDKSSNIQVFILGTNVDEIGALDDIVLRYKTNDMSKTKMIFIQAKHKENETLKIKDLFDPKIDNSLHKYYKSYLKIREKFVTDNVNKMFQGCIKNIECKYVIYTSAKQNISEIKKYGILIDKTATEESFINTKGNIFTLAYENDSFDFNEFVLTSTASRATLLAQKFSKFIFQDNDNYKNMMIDHLIKQFKIFLTQYVIDIKNNESEHSNSDEKDHCVGQFCPSFLTSDDEYLSIMRSEIRKELSIKIKDLSPESKIIEVERKMREDTFKLHKDFGIKKFALPKIKQQKRLDQFNSIFQRIFDNVPNSMYNCIRLDDDSVGPDEHVQSKDLDDLGGLVGNLLILDSETEMLKFNLDVQGLSEDNILILENLKKKWNPEQLEIFRFDINFYNFPKLTMKPSAYDHKLVREFLSNVRIYTNQSKEDKLEDILKDEIYKYYSKKQSDSVFYRLKCDVLFLRVHEKIQKWWQTQGSVFYLTEYCKFYDEAEQEILSDSLLSLVHTACRKKIQSAQVKFEKETIELMGLNIFLKSKDTTMLIITDDIDFSSMKVIQYLDASDEKGTYIFIDLGNDFIQNCFEKLLDALECSQISTLVAIKRESTDIYFQRLCALTKRFKGNIIIITKSIEDSMKQTYAQLYRDNAYSFSNLAIEARKLVLEEREVTFQGIDVTLINALSNDNDFNSLKNLDIFSPNLLRKIIRGEQVVVGKALSDHYDVTTYNYINRSLSQFIQLSIKKDNNNEICLMEDNNLDSPPPVPKDIVIITESEEFFLQTCKSYGDRNVHWFTKIVVDDFKFTIWQQSRGTLKTIMKHVDRNPNLSEVVRKKIRTGKEITTLKDLKESVVIITAEPGMGKSTFLTHLSMQTKHLHLNYWVLKINLLDKRYLEHFSKWQENRVHINIIEAMKFLYSVSDEKCTINNDYFETISTLIAVGDCKEIYINNYGCKDLPRVDLSVIKLINYFYNNYRMALLFDGFDEISPNFADEVIQLLCTLKNSRVAHLWVSSRPCSFLKKLELALGTFSYTLNPLTPHEQLRFVQNLWSQNDRQYITFDAKKYATRAKPPVDPLFSYMLREFKDDPDFMSIPLNLFMLAEIYEHWFRKYMDVNWKKNIELQWFNSIILYEQFITIKFEIQYDDDNPKKKIKNKQKEQTKFFNTHKRIATYLILDESLFFSDDDIESIQDEIENIKSDSESTGIIYCIEENLKFFHYTIAEYLAVEYLFDKLKSPKCKISLWQYLIEKILIGENLGIRKFINWKLKNDLIKIINDLKSKEKHYLSKVLHILLKQLANVSPNALYFAIQEDFEHIAKLLIEINKTIVDPMHLSTFIIFLHRKCDSLCVFCIALTRRQESIIKGLTELLRKVEKDLIGCENMFSEKMSCVSLKSMLYLKENTFDLVREFLGQHYAYYVDYSRIANSITRNGYVITHCWDRQSELSEEQRQLVSNPCNDGNEEEPCDFRTALTLIGQEKLDKLMLEAVDSPTSINIFKIVRSLLEIVFLYKVGLLGACERFCSLFPESNQLFNFEEKPSSYYHFQLTNIILLRVLCEDDIKEYVLRTSNPRLLFHSFALSYKTNNTPNSKMIFIHQQNDLKIDENILLGYFQNYLDIKIDFFKGLAGLVFQGPMTVMDCKFIIYTSSMELLLNKLRLEYSEEENLIKTNSDGKIYKFAYTNEDIEVLLSKFSTSRAIQLAKTLSQLILETKNGFEIYLEFEKSNTLVKMYFIYIAEYIMEFLTPQLFDSECGNHCYGCIRESFLESKDPNVRIMRDQIYEEIASARGLTLDQDQDELKKILGSLVFKVCFDYFSFDFCGDEAEKEKQFNDIIYVIQKLFKHDYSETPKYVIFKIYDDSIDSLEREQLVKYTGLAGLVGQLLVFDDETEMLKFNFSEESLSNDCIKILHRLKEGYHELSNFRFDINVCEFPKLTLNCNESDRYMVKDFLNKLLFYTNQANLEEMTNVLKTDIDRYFFIEKKQNDFNFRIKCDAIGCTAVQYPNACFNSYSTAALNWIVSTKHNFNTVNINTLDMNITI